MGLPKSLLKSLDDLPASLKLDITQLGLDLFGIFDPTPISDGVNGFISLCRGDFFGAAVSAISIIPGADVAKILKLEKYVGSLKSIVRLAKENVMLRLGLDELVKTLKTLVDKLPASSVAAKLRLELDTFLRLPKPPRKFPFSSIKHVGPDMVRRELQQQGFSMAAQANGYRIAATNMTKKGPRGVSVGPKEIWTKYDSTTDGYFVVRMDPQGHATKTDFGGQISVVSQARSGEHLTHGGRPHYHKEWVPKDEYADYLKRPTANTLKFDDAGEFIGKNGDATLWTGQALKATHIPR